MRRAGTDKHIVDFRRGYELASSTAKRRLFEQAWHVDPLVLSLHERFSWLASVWSTSMREGCSRRENPNQRSDIDQHRIPPDEDVYGSGSWVRKEKRRGARNSLSRRRPVSN
jgi:hypothetical protein